LFNNKIISGPQAFIQNHFKSTIFYSKSFANLQSFNQQQNHFKPTSFLTEIEKEDLVIEA